MSLSAILAAPTGKTRRRPGRPGAAGASSKADHLKALNYRLNRKMTEAEVARLMGVTRPTIWAWCRKAAKYPEARQILEG